MDKFVTVWFTIILTMVVCVGLDFEQKTAAIVAGLMMLGIMPMISAHDWIVRQVEKIHANQHTRQRVGIYPYDDWK